METESIIRDKYYYQARDVAIDLYKLLFMSQRNDKFEEHRRLEFIEVVTPTLSDALRKSADEMQTECAEIADDWGPGIGESWENADTHIADAIRIHHTKL